MNNCINCNEEIGNNNIYWKCTKCGKTFIVNMPKLIKIQNQKANNRYKKILKCPSCGNTMDDGKEKIGYKCPVCHKSMFGNIEFFTSENKKNKSMQKYKTIYNEYKIAKKRNKINIILPTSILFIIILCISLFVYFKHNFSSKDENFNINNYNNDKISVNKIKHENELKILTHKIIKESDELIITYTIQNNTNETITFEGISVRVLDIENTVLNDDFSYNSSGTELNPEQKLLLELRLDSDENIYKIENKKYSYINSNNDSINGVFINPYIVELSQNKIEDDTKSQNYSNEFKSILGYDLDNFLFYFDYFLDEKGKLKLIMNKDNIYGYQIVKDGEKIPVVITVALSEDKTIHFFTISTQKNYFDYTKDISLYNDLLTTAIYISDTTLSAEELVEIVDKTQSDKNGYYIFNGIHYKCTKSGSEVMFIITDLEQEK